MWDSSWGYLRCTGDFRHGCGFIRLEISQLCLVEVELKEKTKSLEGDNLEAISSKKY